MDRTVAESDGKGFIIYEHARLFFQQHGKA